MQEKLLLLLLLVLLLMLEIMVFCISHRQVLMNTIDVVEKIILLLLLHHTIGDMLSCSAFSISHAPMSQKIYHTLVAKSDPDCGEKLDRWQCQAVAIRLSPVENETSLY